MTVLLLFTIAVCDLIPLLTVSSLPGVSSSADGGRMLRRVLCVGVLVIIAVLTLLALPVPWWSGPAAALAGGVWLLLRTRTPAAAVVMVAAVGACALVETGLGEGIGRGIPVGLTVAAVLLFLTESANCVTRAVLDLTGRGASVDDGLRGGRVIGPLERILMAVLALFGAQAVIAALAAAKGIVRFPAISSDRPGGTRAEEFLIGSLTSWGLAGGGALLLWAASVL